MITRRGGAQSRDAASTAASLAGQCMESRRGQRNRYHGVEGRGQFHVTGPLETFANAGGVHLARAILAEFADNVARLMAEQKIGATGEAAPLAAAAVTESPPPPESLAPQAVRGAAQPATTASRPAAAELSGGKILWRILVSWLRQVFSRKREAR
jgi:uncharacterized protein